ncbi:MAG: ACP S-malonyltransferase [Saprospiraceae bacterium]|nr:ACP S-malonyltransferase [Saprospiraceae bacterium]MBP7699759.1 ACP S-malonyltransferase [Saprospiraceae bacterium]
MKAYIFPGQGAQFEGMGNDLYSHSDSAKSLFYHANHLLGYDIADIMNNGTAEDLKQTKVTQPAIFLHSVIKATLAGDEFQPDLVAGHSLGEFSALVAAGVLSFDQGLLLVQQRALAMQKACELQPSTMAAIVGLKDEEVELLCQQADGELVIPANYNCPGQLVVSGTLRGVEIVVEKAKAAGALQAVVLQVGGAFHSPLMESAREELAAAIEKTTFLLPRCPIYQNVDAQAHIDPETIKQNLVAQLTAPVRWTQTVQNMIAAGTTEFIEVGGNGKVLSGMVKRIDRKFPLSVL